MQRDYAAICEGPATPERRIVLLGLIGVYPGPQDVYPRIISREISSGYNAKLIIKLNDIWSRICGRGALLRRALHDQDVSHNSALQLALSTLQKYYLQIFIRSKILLPFIELVMLPFQIMFLWVVKCTLKFLYVRKWER